MKTEPELKTPVGRMWDRLVKLAVPEDNAALIVYLRLSPEVRRDKLMRRYAKTLFRDALRLLRRYGIKSVDEAGPVLMGVKAHLRRVWASKQPSKIAKPLK